MKRKTAKQIRAEFQHPLLANGRFIGPLAAQSFWVIQAAIQQFKRERIKRRLTMRQLADLAGIDMAQVSRIESGERFNPTLLTLCRLAQALELDIKIEFIARHPNA